MRRVKRAFCILLCAVIISGCGAPRPTSKIPRTRTVAPTKNLKLAVVITEKTKASQARAHKEANSGMFASIGIDASRPFLMVASVLRTNFASVTMIDTVEQAATADADLIAVVDMQALMKTPTFLRYTFSQIYCIFLLGKCSLCSVDLDASLSFMTLDQKQLELIQERSFAKSSIMTEPLQGSVTAASDELRDKLDTALVASPRLADFAAAKGQEREPLGQVSESAAPERARIYKSDVDIAAYTTQEEPDNYALVIGIEKYSGLPEARFAARDAASIREHLLALGYPPRNIIYLSGARASRAAIEKYVESWLPRNVNEQSSVMVYFSGHGAPDPGTSQAYLMPWDGDAKFLKSTGYPINRLYERLGALKAKRVALVMDSCFSGAGGRSIIAPGARPLVARVDTESTVLGRLSVLAAAGANEITGTDEEQGHGLFTYYFLKALNESGGKASLGELHSVLLPQVQDAARRQNRSQTPKLLH